VDPKTKLFLWRDDALQGGAQQPRGSRTAVQTVIALVAGLMLPAPPVVAAGLWLYEMGTPDLGTASAGRAALAQDAATVFGNPAGMTKLERSQLLVGAQLLYGDVHFDRGSDTTVSGGNGGNAVGALPAGGLYYAQSVTQDFRLGFWSGSYFGLSAQYEDGWSGRYYSTRSELLTLGAGLNGAYRINDWLSIGGGPFALYGKLDQKAAINNVLDGDQDGRLNIDDDDVGVGGMAGVMLEPWQGTRFGVTYVSPVKLEFKNVVSTSNVGPTLEAAGLLGRNVDVDITVPQQVMLSAFHQLTDSWAFMGNLVWQDWSEFGQPEIDIASVASIEADLDYDDTWGFALGVQHAFAERWLWSFGGGYDTSPMSKGDRSPSLPMDRQFRLGTGIQYGFNEDITVGAAYEYMNAGDADLDRERGPLAGRIQGDYKSNDFHFFNVNLSWRF
jgi:long-chain fatty acid transport protein